MISMIIDEGDLRIAITMLETMYSLLHQENPTCGGCEDSTPMDLIVQTTGGQTRNITEHVPVVINHLQGLLAPEAVTDDSIKCSRCGEETTLEESVDESTSGGPMCSVCVDSLT